jgi:plastocyanin domain-containing protein
MPGRMARSTAHFVLSALVLVGISYLGSSLGCGGTASQAQSGTIQMTVTEAGYEPDRIKVKKGVPVTLVITRKTDATCAKEIVIDEHKVNVKLPLNQAVTVKFTPSKSGELKYGCSMDKMISGVIVVE